MESGKGVERVSLSGGSRARAPTVGLLCDEAGRSQGLQARGSPPRRRAERGADIVGGPRAIAPGVQKHQEVELADGVHMVPDQGANPMG